MICHPSGAASSAIQPLLQAGGFSSHFWHCYLSIAKPNNSCSDRVALVVDTQLMLHFFQRDALGLGEGKHDHEEHQSHHDGEEHERECAAVALHEDGEDK